MSAMYLRETLFEFVLYIFSFILWPVWRVWSLSIL